MNQTEQPFDMSLLESENKGLMAERIRAREAATRIQLARERLCINHGAVAQAMTTLLNKEVTRQQVRFWESQFSKKSEEQYLQGLSAVLQAPAAWISHGVGELPHIEKPATAPVLLSQGRTTRVELAQRAKARREAVGISAFDIAEAIGIPIATFYQREKCLPRNRIEEEEGAWEKAIFVPQGWLRNTDLPTLSYQDFLPFSELPCKTAAEEIRMLCCWLARKSPFRRTFHIDDLNDSERRSALILAQRYGVRGEDASTLQVIADGLGLTRQRVQQIEVDMLERIGAIPVKTPMLDLLSEKIAQIVPIKVADLDGQLRSLLGEELSVLSADRFARQVLGKGIVTLTQHASNMMFASEWVAVASAGHDGEGARAVRDAARNMIRSCGAAHVSFVCGEASGMLNRGLTIEETIKACKILPDFEWLSEKDGWFWLGTGPENRLFNIVHKVMAVANRNVETEEIHAALMRSRRERYDQDRARPYPIEMPLSICTEVVKRLPGMTIVQHDDFYTEEPLNRQEILSETENALYELMVRHGGVVARHTMHAELIDKGIVKFMALQVCLDGTPIIHRLDFGLYSLRGYSLDPGMLKAQAETVGGDRASSRYEIAAPEKLPNGLIRYRFEFSEYMERNRLYIVPVSLKRVLVTGDYAMNGFDEPCSYIDNDKNHTRITKFCSKLAKLGFKAGDKLCLTIDPVERRFTVIPDTP